MKHAVKPAQFIPKSVKADVLFRRMKVSHNHFAVVLDEYGGMVGIVTMNDLLEQLVGDLEDDLAELAEEPKISRISKDTWKIDGGVDLEDAAEALEVELPVEDYDTFGGFVFGIYGTIPLMEHSLRSMHADCISRFFPLKNIVWSRRSSVKRQV